MTLSIFFVRKFILKNIGNIVHRENAKIIKFVYVMIVKDFKYQPKRQIEI